MSQIRLSRTLSRAARRRITAAAQVLRTYAPQEWQHLSQAITRMRHDPRGPRGVLAWTGGSEGRGIVFVADPARMRILDLAALMVHESTHWSFNFRTFNWTVVQHECDDCADLFNRLLDPIYANEAFVLRRLRMAVNPNLVRLLEQGL